MARPKKPDKYKKMYWFNVTYEEYIGKSTEPQSFQIEAATTYEAKCIVNDWYLEHSEPKPIHVRVKKIKPDGYNAPIP